MKIKIDIKNCDRINALLAEINGKATAHTLSGYTEIEELAQRAEKRLETSGLLVKDRRGACLEFSPAGPGAAYAKKSFRFTTNAIVIERGTSGWFLKRLERVEKPSHLKETWSMKINAAQAGIITAHAMSSYAIAA